MPPWTMPNSAFGFSPALNSFIERWAQRSDMRIDLAASSEVAGRPSISYGVHSSNCITMSELSARWICIEISGDRNSLLPSIGEANLTPSSVILRIAPSENTWKPPESVRIGPVPAHEAVQAAELVEHLGARAQPQVEGIAEDDLRARSPSVRAATSP